LRLRLDHHAQWEIQQYGKIMYDIVKHYVPMTCESFENWTLYSHTFSRDQMVVLKTLLENVRDISCDELGPSENWDLSQQLLKLLGE
jgi:thymidylate synthase ThyX